MPPRRAHSRAAHSSRLGRAAVAGGLLALVLLAAASEQVAAPSAPLTRSAAVASQGLGPAPAEGPSDAPVGSTTTLAPAAGLVVGRVSAIGDSVMLDYSGALIADLPGVEIDAVVGRQWDTGVQIAERLRAAGELGATVVIGLGTNGPVSSADFDSMMAPLAGASRIVFVTIAVDRPWEDEVNALLNSEAARHPNVAIADWAGLAARHPDWLFAGGPHLPVDGTGAQALAALVTRVVRGG